MKNTFENIYLKILKEILKESVEESDQQTTIFNADENIKNSKENSKIKINNNFNGTEIFEGGIQFLKNGKYIPANELKVVGTSKTIKNIVENEKDDKITLNFTDGTSDSYWGRETPEILINEFKNAKAEYRYTDNKGEWYDHESIYFHGIANRDELKNILKKELAKHCKDEIKKTQNKIAETQEYLKTMNEYIEFAGNN